jgi:membrane protease YdiL (CAAX protease family)
MAISTILLSATSVDNPLLKVALPLLGIGFVWFLSTRRLHLSLQTDLGLVAPASRHVLLWLSLALLWMLSSDYVLHWRGPWDFGPWQAQPLWVSVARVLGVGILGPIMEELICRGLITSRLQKAGLPVGVVIVLVAAGWAAIHIDYSAAVIAIIFVEGLLLGAARYYSRSLVVPILMHIAWNLYAVW